LSAPPHPLPCPPVREHKQASKGRQGHRRKTSKYKGMFSHRCLLALGEMGESECRKGMETEAPKEIDFALQPPYVSVVMVVHGSIPAVAPHCLHPQVHIPKDLPI
jgi:hypothetical protein